MVVSDEYRDATSAIVLRLPAMLITRSGGALHICWRRARALSRWPAVSERAVNLRVQWTAELLSQLIPDCVLERDGSRCSSTNHSSRMPAISKSLIDNLPFRKRMTRSGGKSHAQKMCLLGLLCCGSIHTPPAACLQASQYPMLSGRVGTSWATLIG
jgi:hypothetical protein